jgi:hypothetical protein
MNSALNCQVGDRKGKLVHGLTDGADKVDVCLDCKVFSLLPTQNKADAK